MTEDIKKEIVELLENLTYWDTCPQNYKDRIPTMIEALKQGQSLPIDSFVGQSEQLKAVEELVDFARDVTNVCDLDRLEEILDRL